ncbi:MAG: hypothetical protein MSIBF_02225 [Candidatus Altiarchaeales archaeon IMC4]|nr:MAG: hypothetical protein MSIBF_02225 [Candidatus Altiarchaeales archaeon IMC4]
MKNSIGIIGMNCRAAAQSAKNLGLDVHLACYFADVDTCRISDSVFCLQSDSTKPDMQEYSVTKLVDFAIEKLSGRVGSIIPTSGVGCSPNALKKLEKNFEVVGNGSRKVARAKDWKTVKKVLGRIGAKYPKTIVANEHGLKKSVEKTGFPCVVKPQVQGVGTRARLVESYEDLEDLKTYGDVLVQEYVEGVPVSCSVLSDGENAAAISVNKQIIGETRFGAASRFKYCGNIVPLGAADGVLSEIKRMSENIISALGIIGSNGVDYVLSGGVPYFMEVNTRLQDTMENVEKYRGINMVEKHIDACKGNIEVIDCHNKKSYGKAVVYAKKDMRIGDLRGLDGVSDIPHAGTIVQKSQPVCSVYAEGKTEDDVFGGLVKKVAHVYGSTL